MKALAMAWLLAAFVTPAASEGAELKDVKSVYLYPMVGGMDQYLANQLTGEHVFRVVTDPKLADAILTDQLGRQLEYRLDRLKREAAVSPAPGVPMAATNDLEPRASAFSRGKGTVFLVDVKSRQVVWSGLRRPRSSSSRDLDRAARNLVEDLQEVLNPTAQSSQ